MRIRTIKPEFWRSDDITALPRDLRLLFIGLWSYVDDNGVGVDDYRMIAAELFALEEDQKEIRDYVRDGLDALSRVLLVIRYKVNDKVYLFIPTWDKHQKIDRPGKPRLPRPPEDWKPPTCDDAPDDLGSGSNSRESRETIETVSTRARVNGTGEQGNRGTEEQRKEQLLAAPENSTNKTAQELARAYCDREPLSRFPAIMKIAKRALDSGYTTERVRDALLRLADDKRAVTVDSLRIELDGPPRPRDRGSPTANAAEATRAAFRARREALPTNVRELPHAQGT